ncbi:MAG: pyrroline-5-carboxylate reductase [Clostridia bacterium]|nr:pyrroline-5-carboxylate reductase [Clostridia bacterium]
MKIGFIGGGNMAGAILEGVLASGLSMKEELVVCDKNPEALKKYEGIRTETENTAALAADYVVLAVKPFILPVVLKELADSGKDLGKTVFVSIVAGASVESIRSVLGNQAKIVRVMPNTPATVLEGMTVVSAKEENVSEEEFSGALSIFNAVGKTEVLPESMLNTVIGISGSSPAYVFMMIEAMADAGVRDGLARDVAYRLAAQSVLGSAKMVLETGKHPGELKDMVCSPKGTTIEAVAELENKGFRSAIIDAVKKCNDKANNL